MSQYSIAAVGQFGFSKLSFTPGFNRVWSSALVSSATVLMVSDYRIERETVETVEKSSVGFVITRLKPGVNEIPKIRTESILIQIGIVDIESVAYL